MVKVSLPKYVEDAKKKVAAVQKTLKLDAKLVDTLVKPDLQSVRDSLANDVEKTKTLLAVLEEEIQTEAEEPGSLKHDFRT